MNLLQNETLRIRSALLYQFKIKRDVLEQEVCTRQLGVVMGGGGGCGYGYVGALQLLHRYNIQPQILAGTSMGALIGMFRARTKPFDMLSMMETGRRLSWNKIFRVLDIESRYGVPATLRLYLRAALGSMVKSTIENHEHEMMTFETTAIPLLIVVTGLKMEAFKMTWPIMSTSWMMPFPKIPLDLPIVFFLQEIKNPRSFDTRFYFAS